MFGRNVDFFAVFFIALAMLGFAEVRTWHMPDSIRIENAINVESCPDHAARDVESLFDFR